MSENERPTNAERMYRAKHGHLPGEEQDHSKWGKEMTRGQQTAWIVGTMCLIAFLYTGFSLSGPDERDPHCERGFMGIETREFQSCKAEAAADRLMRIPY